MSEIDFNPFAADSFKKNFEDGRITKIEKYPQGVDEFDKLIIDNLGELYAKKKNVSVNVFEKECLRAFLNQTTRLSFDERIRKLNKIGVPISIFTKETHAMAIGHNPQKK